ncbi:hypothetical protein ADL27_52795, partial [Streptomyces sp. NRRL F-6602]
EMAEGATIQARFEAFHRHNPWVLQQLEALAAHVLDQGSRRIGISMLFELLRYRYGVATHGGEFRRLNNDFRSRYARLICERHPEWRSRFELRALRSE